jgi:FkbM family methyltransferase
MLISRFFHKNIPVEFKVLNKTDVIQRHHWMGCFYEEEELIDISTVIPTRALIIDVGANVGNHLVYFAKFCRDVKIIPFEANNEAILILKQNVELNGISNKIDTSYIGIAVGDKEGFVKLNKKYNIENNLGAASYIPASKEESDSLSVSPLDHLLADKTPDFIKIDVEGMEIDVLLGAKNLIKRTRPVIYVEVSQRNRSSFKALLAEFDYSIDRTHQRHKGIVNYLCVPW